MGAAPDKVIFLDALRAVLMERAQRAGGCEDELLARLDTWDRLQGYVAQEHASRPRICKDGIHDQKLSLVLFSVKGFVSKCASQQSMHLHIKWRLLLKVQEHTTGSGQLHVCGSKFLHGKPDHETAQ